MADIDQIIAGGAGASSRADFSGIGKLPEAYWKGRDEYAKNDLRDAFKGGIPTTADGQPDFAAMGKTLFEKGALNEGLASSKMDLERQKLKFGMDSAAQDFPGAAAQPAPVLPPSSNRGAAVPVAPALNKGGEVVSGGRGSPQGDQPGSIVGMVSGLGVPDELAGPIIAQISAATKMDPNAAVNPQQAQRVAQIVQEAVRRSGGGQPAPATPQAPQQAAPQAPPQAVGDPTLGGLVPPGRTPAQQLELLSRKVASGLLAPEVAKMYEARIKALQDAMAPTQDQKHAAASGKTLEEYQNRADENTAQRDVMTKSLIPRIDASQEKANAARDDIVSIHAAREQLDSAKGIFSGAAAEKRVALAKVFSLLGGDNTKVANTEAYGAAIGQRVASMVKAFGSGTAISDGDRRFAAAMAGGNIALEESSMRRILDIGERAARGKIDQHNQLADKIVGSNEALKPARDTFIVNPPGQYAKPDPVFNAARDAIAKGAPRAAVEKRLREAGHDPSKL